MNPLEVIEQITYLMFIHDLDEADNTRAKRKVPCWDCLIRVLQRILSIVYTYPIRKPSFIPSQVDY